MLLSVTKLNLVPLDCRYFCLPEQTPIAGMSCKQEIVNDGAFTRVKLLFLLMSEVFMCGTTR